MKSKWVIWSSDCDLSDWLDDLRTAYPDKTESELAEIMYETNREYLEDERMNLNITLPEQIVCIADLGLWDGRRHGYRVLRSGNISECLYSEYDATWYVDRFRNLWCEERHHDGTNRLLYRMWKTGISECAKSRFLLKILEGTLTADDISRYTKRIGDPICELYGWE